MKGKDITNERFGHWVALRPTKASEGRWICQCDCGKIKEVARSELIRGRTKSCGCGRKEALHNRAYNKLINQKFGDLTVVEDTGERSSDGQIIWRCECSCGNKNYRTVSSELRRDPPRNKTHCDATIHFIKDISGQTFGEVEVLEFDHTERFSPQSGATFFKCKCLRCSNIFTARSSDLQAGKTQSCGCRKGYSRGAQKVFDMLTENNFSFKPEVSFEDCLTELGRKMYFDFGVYNGETLQYLIEYDGEQHFYYSDGDKTWNTKENFERTQKRDEIKNTWCKEHNIPLIRIPYTDVKSISVEDLRPETSKYLVRQHM